MGHYSAFIGNFWPTFRDDIPVPSAAVKKPSLDNLNIEDGKKVIFGFLDP
jgi:hypothetical protein